MASRTQPPLTETAPDSAAATLPVRAVGIRESRDHLSRYLAAGETLAIERHGHVLGYFLPVKAPTAVAARQAMAQLEGAIAAARQAGLFDEEAVAQALTDARSEP